MGQSPHTLLRNALVTVLAADATIRSLCGRSSGCVLAWSSISAAQFPVLALQIPLVREIDGIGEAWEALVTVSAIADGPRGIETAEALAIRTRELVASAAITTAGIQAAIEDFSTTTIDDADDVPVGRGRVDCSIRYRVEVL